MSIETMTMNPWATINLADINPNLEIIPVGDYSFSLNGAKYGTNDPGRIECNATITSEGDFTGRKIYFSYPNPTAPKCDWSPKMLKRLVQALGVDELEGEDPVAYLNRAAGSHFAAPVKHREGNGEYPTRAELDIFKVRPSA